MDSGSRQAPPGGPPPTYAFVTRYYKSSLRPVVMFCAGISAIFALFAAVGNLRSGTATDSVRTKKLTTISLILGVLYMVVTVIEVLGVTAASMQRAALVRIYAWGSGVTTLIVAASGLLRIVIHFTMKNDIIADCTDITKNRSYAYYPFGFWGPSTFRTVDASEAERWCTRAWDSDSFSEVISFLALTFLAASFTSIAFAYYRQVLDPTSPANVSRVPHNQGWASSYNPPFEGQPYYGQPGYQQPQPYWGPPQPGYGPPPGQFQPPQGPPPSNAPATKDFAGGDGTAGAAYSKENPFADFDEPSNTNTNSATNNSSSGSGAGQQGYRV